MEIGRLKWGVGKIIAHSPLHIRVVPLHHLGMEGVVPQKVTGEPLLKYPLGGNDVTVRVGDDIYFGDLIQEHEQKHGLLFRYASPTEKPSKQQLLKMEQESLTWSRRSTPQELQLYSRITRRIEGRLKEMEMESKGSSDERDNRARRRLEMASNDRMDANE